MENDGVFFPPVEFHFLRLKNCSFVSRKFFLLYFVFVLRKRNFFREASSFSFDFLNNAFGVYFWRMIKLFPIKRRFSFYIGRFLFLGDDGTCFVKLRSFI